ncbi:MAG: hypothetical protein ABFS32_00750 [Bacteroidota bacterium]
MNRYLYYLILFIAVGFISCGPDKTEESEKFLESLEEDLETPAISEETINDILQQIPAPLEISSLIKSTGSEYDQKMLSDPDDAVKYNTNFKRAISLGVYGTDLLYINIFERNQDGLAYMKAIKQQADGLNIGQFFNLKLIGRLASSNSNLDSLMLITTQNFNAINKYLQENRRSNMSILLLTGGWLEGVFINGTMALNYPEEEALKERFGEQKLTMESIMLLLSFYTETDPEIKALHEDLAKLQTAFDKVEITYTHEKPTTKIVDGVLIIEDNSRSIVTLTHENMEEIHSIVSELRNKLLG